MLGENTLLIVFDFFVTVAMIYAIRYIWNRDLLDRPGQVGLGKRGKGEREEVKRAKRKREYV